MEPRLTAFCTVVCCAMLILLSACEPEPSNITWQVDFECSADRERTVQVLLGIAPGECPVSASPVYETAVTRDNQAAPSRGPGELPPGPYAFYAMALDPSGTLVASACQSISLPRPEAVELVLVGEHRCAPTDAGTNVGHTSDQLPKGTAALGELCDGNADCESGNCCTTENCGGGMCTQACAVDADCPVGTLCEHMVCFLECKTDDDCRATWSCEHMGTICEAL